jgi:hypothetical protein
MTANDFYFDFQNDEGAVCHFIKQDSNEKFVFDKTVYLEGPDLGPDLNASIDLNGIAVKGGQVLIFQQGLLSTHNSMTFVSRKVLTQTDEQQFICRLFCPHFSTLTQEIGSFGIVCIHGTGTAGSTPAATWVRKVPIKRTARRRDVVIGLQYNPKGRSLKFHSLVRESHSTLTELIPAEAGENLYVAIELNGVVDHSQSLLTVRECNSDVWTQFLDSLGLPIDVGHPGGNDIDEIDSMFDWLNSDY